VSRDRSGAALLAAADRTGELQSEGVPVIRQGVSANEYWIGDPSFLVGATRHRRVGEESVADLEIRLGPVVEASVSQVDAMVKTSTSCERWALLAVTADICPAAGSASHPGEDAKTVMRMKTTIMTTLAIALLAAARGGGPAEVEAVPSTRWTERWSCVAGVVPATQTPRCERRWVLERWRISFAE